jgi:prepilin-type N-terminal cleavage/methylation domain-containing protein
MQKLNYLTNKLFCETKLKLNSGFSLPELMISIAIIGILTTIATKVYPEYIAKTQVTNALSSLQVYVKNGQQYYLERNTGNNDGFVGATLANLGGDISGQIDTIDANGITLNTAINPESLIITTTFGNDAAARIRGRNLIITMSVENELFNVTCSSTDIADNLLPVRCR